MATLDNLFLEMTRVRTKDVVKDDQWDCETIDRNASLSEAFEKMSDGDFLSLPVTGRFGEYVGFIEMQDLVAHVIGLLDMNKSAQYFQRELFRSMRQFQQATVSELKHRQMRREAHPNFSLYHAFENLARHGDHRVALLQESSRRVIGVVTQKMVLDWIAENSDLLGDAKRRTISDIRPFTSVVKVRASEPAINAFRKMVKEDVAGVAIVNESGRLIGCLSERDLRGIEPGNEKFRKLFSSVESYKESIKDDYPCPDNVKYLLPSDDLHAVIKMLYNHDIHRVFVVDNEMDKKVIDVISMTDVLEYLLRESTMSSTASAGRRHMD